MPESAAGSRIETSIDALATAPDAYSNTSPPRSSSANDIPPARHDSSYGSATETEDDNSEVDVDVQARQVRARERVEILRGRVFRTRRVIKDRRNDLRRLREKVWDAGAQLMKKVDELVALENVQDLKTIAPYHQSLREAQDELGPAEEAYDRLESRLNDEEQDLEQEEDHFCRHNNISLVAVPESRLDDVISPLVKPYQPPEDEFQSLFLDNELVQEYLSKVAEAERLKEDLDDLENDYFRLSGDASFRKRHNVAISAETAIFLAEFPKLHADTIESLHRVEDDLFDLREQCLDQGLFTNADYVYEPRDALSEDVMESVYEARERSPLRVAANNINYQRGETNFSDKQDYVNSWLLEWVQDSTFEALMLRAWIFFKYPDTDKVLEDDKWLEMALDYWDKDSAGDMATESFNASRMDAIAGGTGRLGITSTGRTGLSSDLDLDLDEDIPVQL